MCIYKKIYYLTIFQIFSVGLFAQYYYIPYINAGKNPGNLNNDGEYPSGGGLPSGWSTILTGSNSSPVWSQVQTLPFTFIFNGQSYTQYKVSSSGVLTFTTSATTAPAYTNSAIPSASIPNNSIMIWGIQGTGSNDYIVTKTFGTSPNRQHWIFFSSYTKGSGTYTYWSIVLEETTNDIYIVDQRHSTTISGLTIGIQIDQNTAYGVNNGQNNVSSNAGMDPTPADNSYYHFIYGTQPAYDIACLSTTMPPYLMINQAPFNITGKLSNFGTQTVSSFTLNYAINAGAPVSGNISSVNIPTYGSYNFSHPVAWTPSAPGVYNIKVWVNNINGGNNDQYNVNDTLSFTVNVVDTMVQRHTLLEVFTSSTCAPCAPANANMESILPSLSNYTVIKYQQDFPGAGDPYATNESVARRSYYAINSIPRMEIDGQWDQHAGVFSANIYNQYNSEPSFMSIDITSATYSGNNVNITATITPLIDYIPGNYRYHVVIVEGKTTGNIGTNGETEFFNVMMDMIPDQNGNVINSLNANVPINVTKTTNLANSNVEEMSDLKVVVFVQNNNDKKVLQSAWKSITPVASVDDNLSLTKLKIYPNPAQSMVNVSFNLQNDESVKLNVTDLQGKVVYETSLHLSTGQYNKTLDVSHLDNGLYFMTIETSNNRMVKKFEIAK